MTTGVAARGGLSKKLLLVFALQLAAISFAIVFGVWASASVLERSLMREALLGEADLFAQRLAENPQTPTPDTVNLTTYIASRFVPEKFSGLEPGFHDLEDNGVRVIVYVTGSLFREGFSTITEVVVGSGCWLQKTNSLKTARLAQAAICEGH